VAPEALQAIAQSQLSEIAQHASDAIKKIHEQEDEFREQLIKKFREQEDELRQQHELRMRKLSQLRVEASQQRTQNSWLAAIAIAIAIVVIGTTIAFYMTSNREITTLVLFSMMAVAAVITAGASFFVRDNVAS
jgi:ABC-type multidrug transport system fused ATPase/permease subunit